MLRERKNKLISLALAGALTMGFAATASAQDWYGGHVTRVTYHDVHHYHHYRMHGYAYDHGHYRDRYYGGGPLNLAGAIVGGAVGVADATVAATTGYPYGYYRPAYGYDPYYNNGWWGPYHDQYQGYGYW